MMRDELLRSTTSKRGLAFDPRTKVLATLVVATIMFGSRSVGPMAVIRPLAALTPLVMPLLSHRPRAAAIYLVLFGSASALSSLAATSLTGIPLFAVLGVTGVVRQFSPGIAMGAWLATTTSVSELMAACDRMHMPQELEIPLVVMLRYFPAVADDYRQISLAMRMRGTEGARSLTDTVEARLVPLLVSAVRGSEDLSASALLRGLGGPSRRTNLQSARMRAQDWVLDSLLCAGAVCAVITPFLKS